MSKAIPFICTAQSTTLILDGATHILTSTHPNYRQVREAIKSRDWGSIPSLVNIRKAVTQFLSEKVSIKGNGVYFKDEELGGVIADRILSFMAEGLPATSLALFLEKLMENPSYNSRKQLYGFLEHRNMPITPDGNFLAYKGVKDDYYSVMGNRSVAVKNALTGCSITKDGHVLNLPGYQPKMDRSLIDDNPNHACAVGLHAGSIDYAANWGNRVIIVEINPKNAVSVPDDSQRQKLRACEYKVVGDYTGDLPENFSDRDYDDDWGDDDYCDLDGNDYSY